MKTGNTWERDLADITDDASMEPGHEDREYASTALTTAGYTAPQWSPVMKTGNT